MPFRFWTRWRRSRLAARPLPPAAQEWSARHLRRWSELPPALQQKLQAIAWILYQERRFEASRDWALTDEMKWAVAVNAALMLLGVRDYYFDGVKTILLQKQSFVLPQTSRWMVSHETSAGAAWQYGPIVLSWADCQIDSPLRRGGRNVIIHEFAHHLDGLDGEMGGSIQLPTRESIERWDEVLHAELERLQAALNNGQRTFLDPYAATHPAEFFAVASEYFFERPAGLQEHHPEVFELLVQFYNFNPATLTVLAER
jgi:MtfA peptidase